MAEYTVSDYPRDNLTSKTRGLLDALAANPATANIGVKSGYRSTSKNKKAGGAGKSQHIHGNAIDLDISGLPDATKKAALDTAIAAGAKGIGVYASGNSLHIDPRANTTIWGQLKNAYKGMTRAQFGLLPDWARPSIEALFGGINPQQNPALPDTMEVPGMSRAQALSPALTPEQQANANAHIAYGNSRAANMQPAPRGGYTPPGPPALGMGGYTPPGAPALGMGGYTPPAAPALGRGGYTPPAPALSAGLARSMIDTALGAMPSDLTRSYNMAKESAARQVTSTPALRPDNANYGGPKAPTQMGGYTPPSRPSSPSVGMGGYSPPGSSFRPDNVDRGLLGADPAPTRQAAGTPTAGYDKPASSFRADNIDRSLTGANPRASDVVTGPNAPSWAGRPGVAGSMPAAPAQPSGKLSPSVAGALAQRAGLEAIKDEDLSQVLAKTTVTHPPNPTVGLPAAILAPALTPPTVVQSRPVVVAPAPQAMPSNTHAGAMGSALDNSRNTIGRNNFGNPNSKSQHIVDSGYQTAYGSMGALPGIEGPSMGKIGGAVKGALPGIAGSTVGGLLGGPLGALLGAALAKAATQPGGILSGMQSFNTNAFGTINAAKARGGGAFPDAPSGGYGSGGLMGASFSNRSSSGMSDISPAAARDISRGVAGLY